jgi:hypothetical protein
MQGISAGQCPALLYSDKRRPGFTLSMRVQPIISFISPLNTAYNPRPLIIFLPLFFWKQNELYLPDPTGSRPVLLAAVLGRLFWAGTVFANVP